MAAAPFILAALLLLARKRKPEQGKKLPLDTARVQAEAARLRARGDASAAEALERSLEVLRAPGVLVGMAALGADERKGGEHYGGDDPFDYEHEIFCMQCRKQGTAYVRIANYGGTYRGQGPLDAYDANTEWFRMEPGWTVQMPVDVDAREGYRCPDHQFPRPSKISGPPVPPRMRVTPGWYWYWVSPAEAIPWQVMLRRWGKPLYVLHSRKSWQDAFLGSVELFEVVGQDIVWSMPSPLSRPKPAPNAGATTLFDILAAGL